MVVVLGFTIQFLSLQTPDGFVRKIHWENLLQHETYLKSNLKIAFKLTPQHLNPEGYQKMNVPLAYQVIIKIFFDRKAHCDASHHESCNTQGFYD